MSEFSPIEWCDATWNMLLGCSKCSPGCKNCYAIRTAWRLMHNPHPGIAARYAGLVEQRLDGSLNWTGRINLCPELVKLPLSWKEPKKIFVNSQSDLFHPDVPAEFIDEVLVIMALCPHHTFQVLSKRADRMADYFNDEDLPNRLSAAAGDLLATPATVRFLSCEPLLGPVDIWSVCDRWQEAGGELPNWDRDNPFLIHWVICGGESGPGARPMHPAWARSLRDQCQAAGVPFLFKQWGAWLPAEVSVPVLPGELRRLTVRTPVAHPGPRHPEFHDWPDGAVSACVGKKAAGRLLDGRTWDEFPAANS